MNDVSRRDLISGAGAVAAAFAVPLAAQAVTKPAAKAKGATWVSTQQNAPWQHHTLPVMTASGDPDMIIQTNNPQQTFEGVGACFNELGWDALSTLNASDQNIVFDVLFGQEGANLGHCRMPIGANDFARDWYSYDETQGDFALKNFSIKRDQTALIPFIKEAQKRRPNLKLWASPWSPPSWMKTNGHYAAKTSGAGQPANGLPLDKQGVEGTDMFIQDDAHMAAYARYFAKFIAAYKTQGINIGAVMPQNEFNSAQIFPSCTWTPQGLARFIPHLGRAVASMDVDIYLGTLERPNTKLFNAVYNDPAARPFIKGVGLQWAGKGAAARLHTDYPDLPIWQTEQECGDGKNDWRYCRYAWNLMKHYFNNGASVYQYWNIALKAGGISRWGWAQNSLITVDAAARSFRFNHEFYLLQHLSQFVQPGAKRVTVESWKGYENGLAFVNPDGGVAVIVQNDMAADLPVTFQIGGRYVSLTLPADSFNTLYIPA
jgi:glucosylceramidase